MSNPVRNCVGCGQTDDHPRHSIEVGGGQSVHWHMDCHARTAPPCGICTHQLLDAPAGATGQALRDHITSMPPKTVHPDGRIDVHHPDGRVEHFGADGHPLAAATPDTASPVPAVVSTADLGGS